MPSKNPERRREVQRGFYQFRRGLEVDAALEAAQLFLSPKPGWTGSPTRCIAFYRVYSEEPPHPDYDREAQRRTVERLVARARAKLIGAYEQPEKRGRPNAKRFELGKALINCQLQGAVLIIAKLGHLVDSAPVLSQLAASGVDFVACDKPKVNHRTIVNLAIAAQRREKARTKKRRSAWAALKAKGYRPVNATAEAARRSTESVREQSRIFATEIAPFLEAARRRGCRTLAEIAAALNAVGLETRRGRRWDTGSVYNALKRAESLSPSATQIAAAEKLMAAAAAAEQDESSHAAASALANGHSVAGVVGASAPIFQTGLPGRSSGFAVVEAEARRRYADGERHPNRMGLESPKGWAGVLLPWYMSQYPDWPNIGRAALANRLGPVLRELQAAGNPRRA